VEYSRAFRERLREELIIDEGCVLEVYKDHLGYYTVGVGHLILPSDEEWETPVGTRITQTRADELLFQDFNIMLEECENAFSTSWPHWMPNPDNKWEDWPEEVKLIVCNMAFNLGITRLKKFQRMLTAINLKDYVKASEEGLDSKWAKQVYNRAHRLMDRLRSIDEIDNV
jgi:GH24 family phage-related lysozyme (muramidase)